MPERRIVIAGAALLAAAVAVVLLVSAAGSGSSAGAASTPAKSSGSTTVQRRDLVATDTESGTLSYAGPQTVFNRISGTITWLPQVGDVVKPGQTLYKVDGSPVILMNGTLPAYRSLSEGVSDGADVKQLKQNLVALGFDPSHQLTINETYDAATVDAVDRWQASLAATQTGSVTLGQVVFLPGSQRITAVQTSLGSTGSSAGSGSGSATGASTAVVSHPEFVDLTTTTTTTTTTTATPTTAHKRKKSPQTAAELLALLKAETLELAKARASAGAGGASGGRSGAGGASSGGGGGRGGASGASAAGGAGSGAGGSGGGGSSAASAASAGSATAPQILQTTSTKLVVTVDLDATKQTEAVVGEPVTVQLPDGSTVPGRITQVSPVAQSSSSSSSTSSGSGAAAGGGSGSGSSTPSATIPITIALTGHRHVAGLDQAAVSVNFEQQVEKHVLSVPVTALLATAGGGYAVQQAAAPHRLIPVTPGLFAAGYVQISGSQIFPGLQVTDSQG